MSRYTYTYALCRNTLDVEIPAGWPTERGGLLVEVQASSHEQASRLIDSMWWPGMGYSCRAAVHDSQAVTRTLSDEAKQSIRRKAARRRALAKNPLFAESEIDAAYNKNPDYYGGIRP